MKLAILCLCLLIPTIFNSNGLELKEKEKEKDKAPNATERRYSIFEKGKLKYNMWHPKEYKYRGYRRRVGHLGEDKAADNITVDELEEMLEADKKVQLHRMAKLKNNHHNFLIISKGLATIINGVRDILTVMPMFVDPDDE